MELATRIIVTDCCIDRSDEQNIYYSKQIAKEYRASIHFIESVTNEKVYYRGLNIN
jgi:hypothetical protein